MVVDYYIIRNLTRFEQLIEIILILCDLVCIMNTEICVCSIIFHMYTKKDKAGGH